MGKNIIQQARGKGGPTYRAPSFRYKATVKYNNKAEAARIVDFVRCQGHSSPLVYVQYDNGEMGHLIAATGLRVGDEVHIGKDAPVEQGNVLPLRCIPEGTTIFNIESSPGDGGKFVRSSGTFAKIVSRFNDKVVIQLPSKKEKQFSPDCRASIGTISGSGRKEKPLLKAGNNYHKKRAKNKLYPIVRGQAMNAVDHPYGTSRSSKKGRPTHARKNAPPGAKVGKIRARRTGRRKK